MTDDTIGKKHRENRGLEWLGATIVGAFSGFSGLAANTNLRFRHKLIDSISKSKMEELKGELNFKNVHLEAMKDDPAQAEALAKLNSEVKAIEKRIHLKELYDNHATSLDGNFIKRIVKSFKPNADQTKATEAYLNTGSALKNDFSNEVSKFSKECLGIESDGVASLLKGTVQRFRYMGKDTKLVIATNAAIATTVGAAGTMMFFNSLNTHHKLDQLVKNQNNERS